MGGAYAKNTIDEAAKIMTSVAIEASQSCQSVVTQSQGLTIVAQKGAHVTIGPTAFSQVVSLNTQCLTEDTAQTDITSELDQAATQIAKAISQNFNLPGGGSTAENTAKLLAELSNEINVSFTQTCANIVNQAQNVNIVASDTGTTVAVATLDFDQEVDAIINCVQNTSNVSQVKNTLTQTLTQEATAIVENAAGLIIFIVAIVLVFLGFVIYQGEKAITNWKFLLTVAGIVLVFILLFYFLKIWPFNETNENNNNENNNNNNENNNNNNNNNDNNENNNNENNNA